MEKTIWGPGNPHPQSITKTELIWEGKYDEYGNRREIKLPSTPYPLQRIEAIDEPHGLMHEGINSKKIQFHKRIIEIEIRLADPNVILSSWILSWTPKQELKLRGYNPDEYLKNNVVFMEDAGYLHNILASVWTHNVSWVLICRRIRCVVMPSNNRNRSRMSRRLR